MRPWLIWVILFAVVGGILVAYNYAVFRREMMRRAHNIPPIRDVPPFRLQERSGEFVEDRQLRGKVWVADFIFTRCPGPCKLLSDRLASLHREWGHADDVRFLSFTIDPEHDTPEVMREYAERFGADPARWLFLTGDPVEMQRLVAKGFLLPVTPQEPDKVEEEGLFIHSTRLMLVDKEGRIRAYYDSESPEAMAKLRSDIEFLRGGGR
jgi:protein SCO1/2